MLSTAAARTLVSESPSSVRRPRKRLRRTAAPERFGRELATVGVEPGQRRGERVDRGDAVAGERLDRRVSLADVVAGVEHLDQRAQELRRRRHARSPRSWLPCARASPRRRARASRSGTHALDLLLDRAARSRAGAPPDPPTTEPFSISSRRVTAEPVRRASRLRLERLHQRLETAHVEHEGQARRRRWSRPEMPRMSSPEPSVGRRPELGAAGAEHVGHAIDAEPDRAPLNVDQDPLGAPRIAGSGQPEAHAQIDDRHDLTAVIGDAGDRRRRVRQLGEQQRIDDLLAPS